jgi:two-component system, OmpR family, sensor histidine kinase TctE
VNRTPSLKRPPIIYPLVFHFVTLLASFVILIAVALRIDSGGPYTDERIVPVLAQAVQRDAAGGLFVVETPELAQLRTEAPDLCFVVEDDAGVSVTFGPVPENYKSLLGRLSDLSYAQMRDRAAPYDLAAVLRRETTEIGTLTILGHGALSELGFMVVFATNTIILPICQSANLPVADADLTCRDALDRQAFSFLCVADCAGGGGDRCQ